MSREVGLQAPEGEDLLNYWRGKAEQLMVDVEAAHQMINNVALSLKSEQEAHAQTQALLTDALFEVTVLKSGFDVISQPGEEDVTTVTPMFDNAELEILEGASRGTLKQAALRAPWKIKDSVVDTGARESLERRNLITRGNGRYFLTDEGKKQLRKARNSNR